MGDTAIFWTHGINVVPELTPFGTNTNNDLFLRPTGFGTFVRQGAGTQNWFHLGITTPSRLDSDAIYIRRLILRVDEGREAIVDAVNVHEARPNAQGSPRIASNLHLNAERRQFEYTYDIRDSRISGPVVLSVRVMFNEGSAQDRTINFLGFGVDFHED